MSRVERAIALRDLALVLVKRRGSMQPAGPARQRNSLLLLTAEEGDLRITYRTPFQKLPPVSASLKYNAALLKAVLNRPFAIDVWHKEKKVLLVEWDEDGATNVVSYRPGEWERESENLVAS